MEFWLGAAALTAILFPPSLIVSIPLLLIGLAYHSRRLKEIDKWHARPRSDEEIDREKEIVEQAAKLIREGKERLQASAQAPANPPKRFDWVDSWHCKCESPAEIAFLRAAIAEFNLRPSGDDLRGDINLGLQKQIGFARVDFLINERLVVEIDGHAYHASSRQSRRDANRDKQLRAQGFQILRLTAYRVFSAPDAAMADVRERVSHSMPRRV